MLNRDYYPQFSKEEAEAKDKSFDQRFKEISHSLNSNPRELKSVTGSVNLDKGNADVFILFFFGREFIRSTNMSNC